MPDQLTSSCRPQSTRLSDCSRKLCRFVLLDHLAALRLCENSLLPRLMREGFPILMPPRTQQRERLSNDRACQVFFRTGSRIFFSQNAPSRPVFDDFVAAGVPLGAAGRDASLDFSTLSEFLVGTEMMRRYFEVRMQSADVKMSGNG